MRVAVPTNLTGIEVEILNELLLSDLHLSNDFTNARASFGVKHKEFGESIIRSLFSLYWTPIKEYRDCWWGKSRVSTELTSLHEKWYFNKKKIVPLDLKLTPETCYWWYVGDGCLTNYGLKLSTHSFSESEVLFLASLLKENGVVSSRMSDGTIRIESKSVLVFLEFIGPIRHVCYEYKWKPNLHRKDFIWVK